MPGPKNHSEIIVDAEKLLAAVTNNPDLLSNIEEYRAPLELALTDIKSLLFLQQKLRGDRQKATQDLQEALRRTKDLTIQLRGVIRAKVGIRSEKLVEFRVAPLRKRTRKSKPLDPEVKPPVEPAKPAA